MLEAENLLTHVQLIRLPVNTGFATGNNIAVKAAEGFEWIAFFPGAGLVRALARSGEIARDVALFGSRMLQTLDPERLDGVGDTTCPITFRV